MIRYQTRQAKLLFVGINPHEGSYARGVPFSNNKMFWYLLNRAGVIRESLEDLQDNRKLKAIYAQKFNAVYGLGFVNIISRPTRDVSLLRKGEEIPGRNNIAAIIMAERPKLVCFIGKITYEKWSGRKDFDFGWQPDIGGSKAYVMHFPLRGKAVVRVRELKLVAKAAGLTPEMFTIGHSTRTTSQFLTLLMAHGVKRVVDVRSIPRSRHNPQFNEAPLRRALTKAKIRYQPMKALGGLRHARKDSANTGWRNASFRGYADYMGTDDFEHALEQLEKAARQRPTAIMCAEAVPWRCHRSMIADALVKQGWRVRHIMSGRTAYEHQLTPFLKVRRGRIVYPSG